MSNQRCSVVVERSASMAKAWGSNPCRDFIAGIILHVIRYMHWPRNLLTDSGGFQMVSLLKLLSISEEGVHFQNPRTKGP